MTTIRIVLDAVESRSFRTLRLSNEHIKKIVVLGAGNSAADIVFHGVKSGKKSIGLSSGPVRGLLSPLPDGA
jgi:NADPH-dependent glutamate synthase beta subunit-like oxidoreductase